MSKREIYQGHCVMHKNSSSAAVGRDSERCDDARIRKLIIYILTDIGNLGIYFVYSSHKLYIAYSVSLEEGE